MKKILVLALGAILFVSCGERQTKLFNGKDLTGWTFRLAPDSDVKADDVFGVGDGVIRISVISDGSDGEGVSAAADGEGPGSGIFRELMPRR